jgi:hypothetical protein
VLLELAAERAPGHAHEPGGLAVDAPSLLEGLDEAVTLEGGRLGIPGLIDGLRRLARPILPGRGAEGAKDS